MHLDYTVNASVRGVLTYKIGNRHSKDNFTIYPTIVKGNNGYADPDSVIKAFRNIVKLYPDGQWVVMFPAQNVSIDGEALPTCMLQTLAVEIAHHAAGKFMAFMINHDDVSTDHDGVTLYDYPHRVEGGGYGVCIDFSRGADVSITTDKIGWLVARWL